MVWRILVCVLAGYGLGNINGAIITSHVFHNEDVREKGSGNAGLTNFFRNYGGLDSLIVLLVDGGKAVLACFIGKWLFTGYDAGLSFDFTHTAEMLGGAMSVIGHIFPVAWSWRGGKGIMTCAGITLFFGFAYGVWGVFLLCLAVFVLAVLCSRYVSLGSVLDAVAYPVGFRLFLPRELWVQVIAAVLALMAIYMHRGNIDRILKGTERKLRFRK